MKDAKEEGYGVYVDFDFVYASMEATKMFDGLSNQRDLVKTIDDRYTSKVYYSAATQAQTSYFELAISPSRYEYFYDKVSQKYLECNPIGISLSTLASELNSDFDEDEPYNREDSKQFTKDILTKISNDYNSVMVDSANAYTWGYIDHMINAATDSSRYTKASNSVPFLGVVLHGSVQFAGTPMNMEGNVGHAMLKAIENGAGLYFILSYRNTELLKESTTLNKYYSVRYDIWFDELIERYNDANEALKDLQTKLIIDHDFLIGERVPDDDELKADKELADRLEKEKEEAEKEAARIELINNLRYGRYEAYEKILEESKRLADALTSINSEGGAYEKFKAAYDAVIAAGLDVDLKLKKEELDQATLEYEAILADPNASGADEIAAKSKRDAANKAYNAVKNNPLMVALRNTHSSLGTNINTTKSSMKTLVAELEKVKFAYDYITANAKDFKENIVTDIVAKYTEVVATIEGYSTAVTEFETSYKTTYYEKMLEIEPSQNYYKPDSGVSGGTTGGETDNKVDEGYNYTKYTNDNGNIVAVTYGGKDGVDNDPYRTFILNYNYFSVSVKFEGETYIIPAFGYVVIDR